MLNIVLWDNPILKRVAEPVEASDFGPALEMFGQDMIATMEATSNGVGLSGPQVGISKRIFVMKLDEEKQTRPLIVVNPSLIPCGMPAYAREGCLSFPGLYDQVERSSQAHLSYFTPLGEQAKLHLKGWNARVAQHEFDHLDGIMFFDRMSRQMRKALLRQWEELIA